MKGGTWIVKKDGTKVAAQRDYMGVPVPLEQMNKPQTSKKTKAKAATEDDHGTNAD